MQNNLLQSPKLAGENKHLRPKSSRKPLQPKNSLSTNPAIEIQILKPKHKQDQSVEISAAAAKEWNKENHPIVSTSPAKLVIETMDASLAEELSTIRKKMERLKAEKEKTEKMLNEREKFLDMKMKEMEERSQIQMSLEIEVDRLFRLKEQLRSSSYSSSSSMKISPLRSLREQEHEKKKNNYQVHWQEMGDDEEMEESVTGSGLQSPCLSLSSSSASNSIASQLVTVK